MVTLKVGGVEEKTNVRISRRPRKEVQVYAQAIELDNCFLVQFENSKLK